MRNSLLPLPKEGDRKIEVVSGTTLGKIPEQEVISLVV
jgi:hypothetical protein